MVEQTTEEMPSELEEPSVVVEGEIPFEELEPKEFFLCEVNADCEEGLLCIDDKCGTIEGLYKTECENKCSISSVTVLTSDDETYTLKLGQGSYSYAGALEWKLLNTPQYCPGDDPLVPIEIIKKNAGKVLSKQVLTMYQDETSVVITHPTVKSLKFTAALQEVVEECN